MTTILLILSIVLNVYLIGRKYTNEFHLETGTLYRFKLSTHSKEYYAIFLNETEDGQARVCSPFNWRNRIQNPNGTFEVESPFTVDLNKLYK